MLEVGSKSKWELLPLQRQAWYITSVSSVAFKNEVMLFGVINLFGIEGPAAAAAAALAN